MAPWSSVSYLYDGSFAGFLTCVYESYLHREMPATFTTLEEGTISLWPERSVPTHQDHAKRVYRSLGARISPRAKGLVTHGFLTCLPERELHLWRFIQLGYDQGGKVMADLTHPLVFPLHKATHYLHQEAHKYTGFVRFSQQANLLVGEIEPKNRVLPLLRPHFCSRFSHESFVIYDRTHKEALFYEPKRWAIVPLEDFRAANPDATELNFRQMWRAFYQSISIQERYNPNLRRSHMPKRYWNTMTEMQEDVDSFDTLNPPRKDNPLAPSPPFVV